MADRYILESGTPDGYLLEDGTGVLLLESSTSLDTFFESKTSSIEVGMKAAAAAEMGGALVESRGAPRWLRKLLGYWQWGSAPRTCET